MIEGGLGLFSIPFHHERECDNCSDMELRKQVPHEISFTPLILMRLSIEYLQKGAKAADLGRPMLATSKAIRKHLKSNFKAFITDKLGGDEFIVALKNSGCSHELLIKFYSIHEKRTNEFMRTLRQHYTIEKPTWNTMSAREAPIILNKYRCDKCHGVYNSPSPSTCTICGHNNA
jgi:hypothetical protein